MLILIALVVLVIPFFYIREKKVFHKVITVCFFCSVFLAIYVGVASLSYANGEGGGILFAAAYLFFAVPLYFIQWVISKIFFKNKN